MVVVLPDPFRGIGTWTDFMEMEVTLQDQYQRSKMEERRAKIGVPNRLRFGTVEEVS